MGIGPQELMIIFLIVLLLFGGKKIPEIAKGLGKGLREFRKARDEIKDSIEKEADKEDAEENEEHNDKDTARSDKAKPPATDDKT
jgi:sec-independent protein translocase protein TatA